MNEFLLIICVPLIFGGVLLAYRLFGKDGLYAFTAIATLLANIEVLILVSAFGIEQTLGNVMFAAIFLISDILSENHGKKAAERAVYIGLFTGVAMIVFSYIWLQFTPSESDTVFPAIKEIFSRTPRLLLASLLGFAVSQMLDVLLYHKIWQKTAAQTGDKKALLWLRNNASTLISQLANTVIFNFTAFYGKLSTHTIIAVMCSSYIIYVLTSVLGTPFVYLARKMDKS